MNPSELFRSGSKITPILPRLSGDARRTGFLNPSIYRWRGEYCAILRSVNYVIYHSESKQQGHPWGHLLYLHPENDAHLRTNNYFCRFNPDLSLHTIQPIDTSEFDTYTPKWQFVGLEDARLFEWDDQLYMCGVRRDTNPDGQGRMEMSEISVTNQAVKEVSRWSIPLPESVDSHPYCEKNWMPVLDQPFHFVRWANPVEVLRVDPSNNSSHLVYQGAEVPGLGQVRGGSQVIPWNGGYLALTHWVEASQRTAPRPDGVYRHRLLFWNRDWQLQAHSDTFDFLGAHIEFGAGMCLGPDDAVTMSFGYQDNLAFLATTPNRVVMQMLGI